jgi:hypothetical protein
MHRWAIVVVLAVASCGDATEPEQAERFAGMWLVDQPFHAGYEATVYELGAGGDVRALDACDLSAVGGDDYVTGTVESESGVRCRFGSDWSSDGPDTLLITGDCDDGRDRVVALGFDSDTSLNSEGTLVVVDSVAGESGWDHRDFDWQWTRCPTAGCEPVWVCR